MWKGSTISLDTGAAGGSGELRKANSQGPYSINTPLFNKITKTCQMKSINNLGLATGKGVKGAIDPFPIGPDVDIPAEPDRDPA